MRRRGSGILLHVTSLPSPFGIGDLGPGAYKFADFLSQTKQSLWQVLPLNPTDLAQYSSPYSSISALAANPLLISPELMLQDGLLTKAELESLPHLPEAKADCRAAGGVKEKLFDIAWQRFRNNKPGCEYERFCVENSGWLDEFALFVALKSNFRGKIWSDWPVEVRDREPEALNALKSSLAGRIEREKFLQYLFFKQWFSLKHYCNHRGIQIIGDIPIYVSYDSVDVWVNTGIFKLDEQKQPSAVAGVPPDYFSETGQRWGNPLYRWDVLKETGYTWWLQRMEQNLKLFDSIRIDHFKGLVAYWEIPAHEKTAIHGRWVEAPAGDFLKTMLTRFPCFPVIAEDLGVITPDVREIMHHFDIPGMKVLLFAFDEDRPEHPYLPHNYERNCVVYTGTHDNNTVKGWLEKEAAPESRKRLFRYLGQEKPEDIHWELIRLAMMSAANAVIVPLQDILGLGQEARMNRPATTEGNWQWRLLPEQLTPALGDRLLELTRIYGRSC